MIAKTVEDALGAVEEKLQTVVATDVALLAEASRHIVGAGGKRLRPRLALLAYLAAGGCDLAAVIPMAAAIELVHTATLVHDDINDHSPTRRGRPAVHARWGRTFALLTGDFLFTKVYALMAPYGPTYNVLMADACVKLVEGETLQAAAAKSGVIDRATYKQIIARKTASLFEAAARMAAHLAQASEATIDALGAYAFNLGLAFQITDDILDIIGDTATFSQPAGAGPTQGLALLAAENGHGHDGAATTAADSIQLLMARLRDSGAAEVAGTQAALYAGRAGDALTLLSPSPARAELESLITVVVGRRQ